ncbi:RNA-binding protein 25, partial [Phenoliferia sp. Uapishka_3]
MSYGGGPPSWQQQPPHFQQQGHGFQGQPPNYQHQQQHNFNQHPPPQNFRHAGLGAPGAAPNLPPPPNLHQGAPSPYGPGAASSPYGPTSTGFPGVIPSQAWNGEKFSLFVGSIADGIVDGWLERILGTAGPVLSLRRPSPPFAFVEYGDPESVLRCLEVVNGATLQGKSGTEKTLLVKADEKTRTRLDQYEASRVKNEQTEEFLLRAKDDLEAIVRLMKSGEAPATSTMAPADTPTRGPPERGLTHLQDLAPEDLPETSREVITGEIALFRERAAKRAAEKKEREDREAEQRRNSNMPSMRRNGPTPQQNNGWGPRGGSQAVDPQSYNKPIDFVAGGVKKEDGVESKPPPGPTDEERERERLERERREAEAMYRDRERRLEQRERGRIQNVERERARERGIADQEDRDRVAMRERLSTWDDDKEAERGHETFYSDRQRWRAQRRPFRAREIDSDARDRAIEAQQIAALHKESEDFLERQADMFAKITEGKNRAVPRLLPADEGVKLSFGAVTSKVAPKAQAPIRPTVLGIAEDEDEGKKKRELIKLDYSDDEEEKERKAKAKPYRMTEREKERKARDIKEDIPTSKEDLWSHRVAWSELTEEIIARKLKPMATDTIVEYLGAEEEELLNAVVDHVRAHKGAAALVEELEPVLDEEATEFVRKIWRSLVYELALAQAGISF